MQSAFFSFFANDLLTLSNDKRRRKILRIIKKGNPGLLYTHSNSDSFIHKHANVIHMVF